MSKHPTIPESFDDAELLREALEGVAPLPHPGKVVHQTPKPAPVPVQRIADEAQVLADSLSDDSLSDDSVLDTSLESGDELVFLRNGLSTQILRKLRRGHWAVQDHIDLHGLRSDAARELLIAFLKEALNDGFRCVRVVHGKGHRSRHQNPVLKKKMAGWLGQRDEVLAYCQAPQADGGSGALVILLKARRQPRPVSR
jgi:DNA-nicking Smr family endonuclease